MSFFTSLNQKLMQLKGLDFLILFFLRIYLAYIFWVAGVRKIAWDNGKPNIDRFADFLGPGGSDNLNLFLPNFFGWLAVLAEAGGAVLLLLGLFSRWAVIPLIITMLVAFYYHLPNGWSIDAGGVELTVTYIVMLSVILIFGPGKYLSLDYWVLRK